MSHRNYNFTKFPLYANETPVFRKQPNQEYIAYGKQNDYPDYLAYLYNNSGIHAAIIKGKSTYIFGKGFKIREEWNGDKLALEQVLKSINPSQTADELSKKKIFEKTLYGGAAYLVEWDVFGKLKSVKLQAFNTIRTNEDRSEFYISKEWTKEMSINTKWKKSNGKLPEDAVTLPAFNPTEKKGKQILYLADENPASDIYPLPEYGSGNTAIETDIECNFFQLNNIKTGFAAGTMVTFFNGTATNPEEQIEIEHAFKKKTSGTDNAGEILLNFQNPNTTAPEIKPLRSNELDKQYEQLSKDTINKILYSHRVSNGLLFGIKTPGELGGNRSEFDLAWEHFSNTYVKPKQQEEEEDMNYLLQYFGFYGNPVKIIPLDPIGIEITVEDVMSVLTFEEKRKLIFDKLGMIDETKKQIQSAFSSSKDFILEKFKTIGESADNYEIVEECFVYSKADKFAESKEDKVMKYLSENQKATISKIAEALGMSKADVYKTIETLGTQNKLIVKYTEINGEIQARVQDIQSTEEVNTVNLETKWRYTTNLSPKLLDTSREFCIDMINQNKLYTRAEIDLLQNEASTAGFNDDVFMYKGGWMTIKGTNTHVPQCRHFWQSVIVKKK
jgi:hypothetical protein